MKVQLNSNGTPLRMITRRSDPVSEDPDSYWDNPVLVEGHAK